MLRSRVPHKWRKARSRPLTNLLFSYLKSSGLGHVLTELRCIFGPPGDVRTYVPDVVYVAAAHLPIPRHLHAAPDLAIEVLSPDQNIAQMQEKIRFFLDNGVRLVWVIDPERRTITVHSAGQRPQELGAGGTLDGGDLLPGFSVAVDDIFAEMPL